MHREVADQVCLGLTLVVPIEAGVDDEDVALFDLHVRSEHVGSDHIPVVDHVEISTMAPLLIKNDKG